MPVTIGNGPTSEVGRIVNFRDASQLRSALNAAVARKSQPEAEKYREKKACKEAAEASQALFRYLRTQMAEVFVCVQECN